jgi:vacuolar-type H+-ATPase subunit I/STV1
MSEFTLQEYSLIPVYKQFVAREKTIYRALNMAKEGATFSIGLVWVPLYRQQEFLSHVTKMQDGGINIHVKVRKQDKELTVPTMFRTTEFAAVFQ